MKTPAPAPPVVRPVGLVAALLLSLGTAAVSLSFPTAGAVASGLYLAAALALAATWCRERPERLFEFALWLWVLAPGVRRAVDLVAGYHPDSYVLLAAPAVSLLAGLVALKDLPRLPRRPARLVLRVLVLAAYGSVVALLLGRAVTAVALAAVQLLAPAGLGALAMASLSPQQRLAVLERFVLLVPLLVGGYGVIQFLVAPAWDAQWLRDVDDVATSFGRPFPLEIRVFSTVNDPGSLAVLLTACLLWLLLRTRLGLPGALAMTVGTACLALTLVRSAWIALALAVALSLVRGWLRPQRLALAAGALAVVFAVSGSALAPVVERFESSTSSGTSDESYQARIAFQSEQLLPALASPTGAGLASTGTAVRRDAAADQRFADTDSGYIEILRTYGGPLGGLLLVTLFGALLAGCRRVPPRARGAAALLSVVPVLLFFGGVLTGVTAVVLWCCLAAVNDDAPRPEGSEAPAVPRLRSVAAGS